METEAWRIRRASEKDLDAIHRIEQATQSLPWSRESLHRDLAGRTSSRYWVAEHLSAGIIGYAACWLALDEVDLVNLAVHPDWHRQGVATCLLASLEGMLTTEGIQRIFVEVRANNQAALALYRCCGFSQIGERKAYYSDNKENAIIMTKFIGRNDE